MHIQSILMPSTRAQRGIECGDRGSRRCRRCKRAIPGFDLNVGQSLLCQRGHGRKRRRTLGAQYAQHAQASVVDDGCSRLQRDHHRQKLWPAIARRTVEQLSRLPPCQRDEFRQRLDRQLRMHQQPCRATRCARCASETRCPGRARRSRCRPRQPMPPLLHDNCH